MTCHGNGDHCCTLGGVVCPFLEEGTVPGRRWACGLLRKLGSWDAVAVSPVWHGVVGPLWDKTTLPARSEGHGCWDWPQVPLETKAPGRWACCWGGD